MPKVFLACLCRNAVFLLSLLFAIVILILALPPASLLQQALAHPALLGHAAYWQALAAPPPHSLDLLAYERPLIAQGQYWRLLGGHIVHLNINHALMNCAGLLLLAYYFRRDFSPLSWFGLILVSMLSISAGLWWGLPWLIGYAGLSGVLHALLYAGLIVTWRELPRANSIVLALMIGRLFWEHSAAYDPMYLEGVIHGRVIPAAHFFGAMTGAAWGLLTVFWPRRTQAPA